MHAAATDCYPPCSHPSPHRSITPARKLGCLPAGWLDIEFTAKTYVCFIHADATGQQWLWVIDAVRRDVRLWLWKKKRRIPLAKYSLRWKKNSLFDQPWRFPVTPVVTGDGNANISVLRNSVTRYLKIRIFSKGGPFLYFSVEILQRGNI